MTILAANVQKCGKLLLVLRKFTEICSIKIIYSEALGFCCEIHSLGVTLHF